MEEWHKSKTGIRKLRDWGAWNTLVLWEYGMQKNGGRVCSKEFGAKRVVWSLSWLLGGNLQTLREEGLCYSWCFQRLLLTVYAKK